MTYLKRAIINKLVVIIALSTTVLSDAGNLQIFAHQTDESIDFYIENTSAKVVILGDPERSGVMVKVKSDRREGHLDSSVDMTSYPWKHLVLLSPKGEDRPHLSSHKFSLKANRKLVGTIEKIEVLVWFSTEQEFLKNTLMALKHVRIEVQLLNDIVAGEASPNSTVKSSNIKPDLDATNKKSKD